MSDPAPTVQRKSIFPTGAIPKGRQTWIMLGVALAVIGAVVFTGGSSSAKPTQAKTAAQPPPVRTSTTDEIARFQKQLEQQAEQLKLSQERAAKAQAELDAQMRATPAPASFAPNYLTAPAYAPAPVPQAPPPKPVDPVEEGRKKLEYSSLFASNMALSYRIPERRDAPPAPSAEAPPPVVSPKPKPESTPVVTPVNTQHRVFEGTIIETALQNQLDGSFSGPVSCLVVNDVWSHNRQHLLIPKGARALGESEQVQAWDQQRLAVTFHRLIMPDGYSVDLEQATGLDQIGSTALKDKVNNHYLAKFTTSIAMGLIAGLSLYGTGNYYTADGGDLYRQSVANQIGQDSRRILQQQMNRMPTITIRPGTRVKIWVARDFYLPTYEAHSRVAGVN